MEVHRVVLSRTDVGPLPNYFHGSTVLDHLYLRPKAWVQCIVPHVSSEVEEVRWYIGEGLVEHVVNFAAKENWKNYIKIL